MTNPCAGCGAPTTRTCPVAVSLACGAPLCDRCEHANGTHRPIPEPAPPRPKRTPTEVRALIDHIRRTA